MSKVLKVIVDIIIIIFVLIAAALLVPPLLGITTVVAGSSVATNMKHGSVAYGVRKTLPELKVGDEIIYAVSDAAYIYEITDIDTEASELSIRLDEDSEIETIEIKGSASKKFLVVPYLGYVSIAMESRDGRLILLLAVVLVIILFIIAEIWSKKLRRVEDDEEELEDGEYFKSLGDKKSSPEKANAPPVTQDTQALRRQDTQSLREEPEPVKGATAELIIEHLDGNKDETAAAAETVTEEAAGAVEEAAEEAAVYAEGEPDEAAEEAKEIAADAVAFAGDPAKETAEAAEESAAEAVQAAGEAAEETAEAAKETAADAVAFAENAAEETAEAAKETAADAVGFAENAAEEAAEAGEAAAEEGMFSGNIGDEDIPMVEAALEAALESTQVSSAASYNPPPRVQEPAPVQETVEEIELAIPVRTLDELVKEAYAAGEDPQIIKDSVTGVSLIDYSDCL